MSQGVGLKHCPLAYEMPPTQGHVLHSKHLASRAGAI